MRKIKYRAWDKQAKKMEQWEWVKTQLDGLFNSKNGKEEFELIQFTGLKDKNGKEIYEGDIVKTRELNKVTDPVDYGMNGLTLSVPQVVKFEDGQFVPLAGWTPSAIEDMEWEIIGNVHQHPELIK